MCNFFSFVTTVGSKKYYFNWQQRKQLLKSNPENYEDDSHTSIAKFFHINEDKCNKFTYDPLTKKFRVDQINIKDDQSLAKRWVEKLDFKTIIKSLILKPIIDPFNINPPEITEKHIKLLTQWSLVWSSVEFSVESSVRSSVKSSIGASVWDSVWSLVWSSFVESAVMASGWSSVRNSVMASGWFSVRAYTSSFFHIKKWKYIDHEPFKNPFQPCIDLWEMGLVPSFDGKMWKLHGGEKAGILYELTP